MNSLDSAILPQSNGDLVTREAVERARTLLLSQPDDPEPALAAIPALVEKLVNLPDGMPAAAS